MRLRFAASDLINGSVVEAAGDGIEIKVINCDAGGPICADSGTLIEGVGQQNDFVATCGSDEVRWGAHGAIFAFQVSDRVTQFELRATSPTSTPSSVSIDVEARKQTSAANLNLRGSLFNYMTGQYVALPGILSLSTTDSIRVFDLPGVSDPADFVEPGTNEVRLLLQTIQTSGSPNVRTQIDEVLFNVD
jgi:hypothetical protein